MKHFHEFYARFFSDDDETDTVDGSTSQKIRQKKENNSSVAAKSATPPSFKESRFFHGNRYSLTFIFVLSFIIGPKPSLKIGSVNKAFLF